MTMAVAPNDNDEETYKKIVKNYFADRLTRKGYNINNTNNLNGVQHEVAMTLRRVGDELEARNSDFFEHMCDQLNINANTAYTTFKGIADEIFCLEKNWGRIVAFLTFGSTLAVHCASRQDMGIEYVDRIVGWVARYMTMHLDEWIQQHGSWNGFVDFFDRTDNGRNGNANANGFILSALAGLGIGALLTISFK